MPITNFEPIFSPPIKVITLLLPDPSIKLSFTNNLFPILKIVFPKPVHVNPSEEKEMVLFVPLPNAKNLLPVHILKQRLHLYSRNLL